MWLCFHADLLPGLLQLQVQLADSAAEFIHAAQGPAPLLPQRAVLLPGAGATAQLHQQVLTLQGGGVKPGVRTMEEPAMQNPLTGSQCLWMFL